MQLDEVVDTLEALVREQCHSLCVAGEYVAWSRAEERAMRCLVGARRMVAVTDRFVDAPPDGGDVRVRDVRRGDREFVPAHACQDIRTAHGRA